MDFITRIDRWSGTAFVKGRESYVGPKRAHYAFQDGGLKYLKRNTALLQTKSG